jgi:oxygen-independent coproporphyrinogen-3 oxidase
MGYTTQSTGMLLGLGVSSISDTGNAFAQNEKTLHDYYASVDSGELAIKKGYQLSEEDVAFKKYILAITCQGAATFNEEHLPLLEAYTFPRLEALALTDWWCGIQKVLSLRSRDIILFVPFAVHLTFSCNAV